MTTKEEVVFTHFTEAGLRKLQEWLETDTAAAVKNAFGVQAFTAKGLNRDFLASLLAQDVSDGLPAASMMATIRTHYHALVDIGFVRVEKSLSTLPTCCINYLYVCKAFRHKDYEYQLLQRAVQFALREYQCERCHLWITATDYLYLSIVKTLGFSLVKVSELAGNETARYCYSVAPSKLGQKLLEDWQRHSRLPDLSIPNYISCKQRLQDINKVHVLTSTHRKRRSAAYYSPILNCSPSSPSEQAQRVEYSDPPVICSKGHGGYPASNNPSGPNDSLSLHRRDISQLRQLGPLIWKRYYDSNPMKPVATIDQSARGVLNKHRPKGRGINQSLQLSRASPAHSQSPSQSHLRAKSIRKSVFPSPVLAPSVAITVPPAVSSSSTPAPSPYRAPGPLRPQLRPRVSQGPDPRRKPAASYL